MFGNKKGKKGNKPTPVTNKTKEPSRWTFKGRKARAAAKKAAEEAAAKRTAMLLLNILRWCIVAFLIIGALAYMPSVGSFVLILAAILAAPIPPIQDYLARFLRKKWIAPLLAVVLFFVGVGTADTGPRQHPYHSSPSISSPATQSPLPSTDVLDQATASKAPDPLESEPMPSEADPSADLTLSSEPSEVQGASTLPEDSSFEVHYIDVGQADAALVLCDGEAMLIDGGNAADSNLIYTYLKNHGVDHLNYIVCTHAHEDHVGGLAGALNYATADVAYCSVKEYDSKAFSNFVKYLGNQGLSITIPNAGDTYTLGSSTVSVLGPIRNSDEPNNMSIVLRIVYGETSFLFTGDAERDEESDILDAGYTLSSTVLKVGHHGSDTSTTYPFLREVAPEYAVISVGTDNSYGHPTENTLSRLRDADVKVYRTDMQGDVICTSDGKSVSFEVERNADADTLTIGPNSTQATAEPSPDPTPDTSSKSDDDNGSSSEVPSGTTYVLNTNTHKFHYPGCSSVRQMSEKNKSVYTGTREEVIGMGYSPCGRCNP